MTDIERAILTAARKENEATHIETEKMTDKYIGFHATGLVNAIADAEDNLLGHIKYGARMDESFHKMIAYANTNDSLNFYSEYAEFLKQKNNAQLCAEDFKQAINLNNN